MIPSKEFLIKVMPRKLMQLTDLSAAEFWIPSGNNYQIIASLPAVLLSRREALQFQLLLHLISAKSKR